MLKRISVMMNTDQLGGAERSLVLQLSEAGEGEFTFYVPALGSDSALISLLREHHFNRIVHYQFPPRLYSVSRSKMFLNPFIFVELMQFIFSKSNIDEAYNSDHVYINGNKIAFLFLAKNLIKSFRGKITWHLRDYYHSSKLTNFIWQILTKKLRSQLEIVANSISVQDSLKESVFSGFPTRVVYNPSGLIKKRPDINKIENIGFVSMMAPWKGVHEIVFFAWLYESELKRLGIKKISIYGDNLYKTSGEHCHYKEELQRMITRWPSELLSFQGMKKPEEIFSEIDCLIHYSLRPEPFGRVLIEAYESGVPVISTGLGGAGEIVSDFDNAFKVHPYDRRELFNRIKELSLNNVLRADFIKKSIEKSHEIQKDIKKQIRQALGVRNAS